MDKAELKEYYNKIDNEEPFNEVCKKLGLEETALMGLIEYLKLENFKIDIKQKNGETFITKPIINKGGIEIKPSMKKLEHIKLCIISDTHIGCIKQQSHLINKVYREAHRRGITTVLHCGDLVDGDYRNKRPAWPYQLFAQGYDQQKKEVVENYPYVEGIDTYFICGSHDETHFLNGGADIGKDVDLMRPDMHYLGMDKAIFMAGKNKNVSILMQHPGGGVAKSLSYKPQESINKMETGTKPKILIQGHYHKSYYMFYRNVHAILVPCLVGQSPFMRRMDIPNIMGAYFLDIYVNEKGEIQYFQPEEYLFDQSEEKVDDYKIKKLVIKAKK